MTMKRLICLIALAAIALPSFAESARRDPHALSFASDFQTVPVMANSSGAGGVVFQSYVAILNPTSSAFPVNVSLYDVAGNKYDAVITLAAGEQKTYENFLDAVFHRTGGGAVTFRSDDPANRFVLNAEVRTAGHRYGTSIPAVEFAGTDSPSFAPGVTVGTTTRTNIGCFNQSAAANSIKASVLDASGTQILGTLTLNLPANAWGQTAVSTIVTGGYIEFEPSDTAVCYAVVVDNTTHDGRFIPAAEYRP
jgi:hypothetical protein